MIIAELEHMTVQIAPTPNMQRALDFLRQVRGKELPDGKVEIDGNRVFALAQSYETVAASDPILFEAHRKYIDVQYVAAGQEIIGWASAGHLTVAADYDEAKEAWFGTLPAADTTFVRLAAGELAVLYPTDGHAPRLAASAPAAVKKIVVKVAVES